MVRYNISSLETEVLNENLVLDGVKRIVDKFNSKMFMRNRTIINLIETDDNYKKIIDLTKGNLTKLKDYSKLVKVEMILSKKISEVKDETLTNIISTLQKCRNNIESYSSLFNESYKSNNSFFQMLYTTTVAMYINGLSMLMSNITNPTTDMYNNITINIKKTNVNKLKKSTLFKNITMFNALCKNNYLNEVNRNMHKNLKECYIYKEGDYCPIDINSEIFNEADNSNGNIFKSLYAIIIAFFKGDFKTVLSSNKPVIKALATKIGIAIFVIIVCLIIINFGAYVWYHSRIKLSEKLESFSEFLQLSSEQANDPKVKERQAKLARKFKSLADKIAIDSDNAESKANQNTQEDSNKSINETNKETSKDNNDKTDSNSDLDLY